MKNIGKVISTIIAYNFTKTNLRAESPVHVGRRTNMPKSQIPNNGGL